MKKLLITDLTTSRSRLLPESFGDARVTRGGVYVFAPGETAHPEPVHVFIVEAGEDHHTRSSVEDPLVAAWWVLDR